MIATVVIARSQSIDTARIKLDLLRAPSSPGANLLGFAVSDIERPSDVSEFMLTLQSATNSNSLIPSSYAVDLAPFWMFRAKGLTADKFNSVKFSDVFRQSFVISTAIRNTDSSNDFNPLNLYQSFGTKFSIVRGKLSNKTISTLDSIHLIQSEIASGVNLALKQKLESDSIYKALDDSLKAKLNIPMDPNHPVVQAIMKKIEQRLEIIKIGIVESYDESLKKLEKEAASFKIERFGFFIDFAGGISLEYVNRTFNQSRVYNAGAWLTFGANYQNGLSIMGITRYLQNPEKVFADDQGILKNEDVGTFDAGARIIYNATGSRFSASTEAIYRSVLTKNTIDPSLAMGFKCRI